MILIKNDPDYLFLALKMQLFKTWDLSKAAAEAEAMLKMLNKIYINQKYLNVYIFIKHI